MFCSRATKNDNLSTGFLSLIPVMSSTFKNRLLFKLSAMRCRPIVSVISIHLARDKFSMDSLYSRADANLIVDSSPKKFLDRSRTYSVLFLQNIKSQKFNNPEFFILHSLRDNSISVLFEDNASEREAKPMGSSNTFTDKFNFVIDLFVRMPLDNDSKPFDVIQFLDRLKSSRLISA